MVTSCLLAVHDAMPGLRPWTADWRDSIYGMCSVVRLVSHRILAVHPSVPGLWGYPIRAQHDLSLKAAGLERGPWSISTAIGQWERACRCFLCATSEGCCGSHVQFSVSPFLSCLTISKTLYSLCAFGRLLPGGPDTS